MSTQDMKLTLGGKDLTLVPMNFKTIKKVLPLVQRLQGVSTVEQIDLIGEIIFNALKAGNDDITQDFIDENLTLGNSMDIMYTVLEASGLKKTVGENQPVA